MNEQKAARNEVCVICGKENPTVSVRLSASFLKSGTVLAMGTAEVYRWRCMYET